MAWTLDRDPVVHPAYPSALLVPSCSSEAGGSFLFSTPLLDSPNIVPFSEQFFLTESLPFATGNCATSTERSGRVYRLLFRRGDFGANWVLNMAGWKAGLKYAGKRIVPHETKNQRSSWSRNAFWREDGILQQLAGRMGFRLQAWPEALPNRFRWEIWFLCPHMWHIRGARFLGVFEFPAPPTWRHLFVSGHFKAIYV